MFFVAKLVRAADQAGRRVDGRDRQGAAFDPPHPRAAQGRIRRALPGPSTGWRAGRLQDRQARPRAIPHAPRPTTAARSRAREGRPRTGGRNRPAAASQGLTASAACHKPVDRRAAAARWRAWRQVSIADRRGPPAALLAACRINTAERRRPVAEAGRSRPGTAWPRPSSGPRARVAATRFVNLPAGRPGDTLRFDRRRAFPRQRGRANLGHRRLSTASRRPSPRSAAGRCR